MRTGLFGGTFDPVHFGHLLLAETCREVGQLDEIWFVPAARSPHKPNVVMASAKQRVEMLRFAIAGHPQFRISKVELERPAPSYTVDTLRQLQKDEPNRQFVLLMGADSLHDLPTWRDPEAILDMVEIMAVSRGREAASHAPVITHLGEQARQRIQTVVMPAIDISASDLRERARTGRSLRFLTPRPVELFIQQHGLYRDAASGEST
ncbi:MAG: nicotinate-nucleotide adenylyltransferase [Planctomycetaceae bacterium]|nr:nicotinate-nucleotide adenylyltransferase [Planctomycetaceae bacterium]MCB9951884.1 nicotinate (nicotinamide) nucleotide adenylyltransferase [Planctomycetaceae bacterium]